jgi:hypothetical protein
VTDGKPQWREPTRGGERQREQPPWVAPWRYPAKVLREQHDLAPMRKCSTSGASILALAMLALAPFAEAQTQGAASSVTVQSTSGYPPGSAANPHILTHQQLLKLIRLNQHIGNSQEIIGAAATALHLTRNENLPVHGLDCALKNGHSIDFAQFRQDMDGFVFTETNRDGNFMFHVDSDLNPIAAIRIIGATSMSPIVVVPLSLDEPASRENLGATLSAWAAIIDKLAAADDPAVGRP